MLLHASLILYTYRKYLLLFCSFSPLFPSFHGGQKGPSLLFLLFSRFTVPEESRPEWTFPSLFTLAQAHWTIGGLGDGTTVRLVACQPCVRGTGIATQRCQCHLKQATKLRGEIVFAQLHLTESELKLTLNLNADPVWHNSQSLMVDATLGYPRFNALPSRMRRADEKERLQDKSQEAKSWCVCASVQCEWFLHFAREIGQSNFELPGCEEWLVWEIHENSIKFLHWTGHRLSSSKVVFA